MECAMNKKYIVRLSDEERRHLTELTRKGTAAAYKIRHAHILLKADTDGPAWTDERIAESFSVSINTVQGVRQRLVEQGLEAALNRKKQTRPSRPPLLFMQRLTLLLFSPSVDSQLTRAPSGAWTGSNRGCSVRSPVKRP